MADTPLTLTFIMNHVRALLQSYQGSQNIIITNFVRDNGWVGRPIDILHGGTNATTADNALTNFGATTLGKAYFTSPNQSAIRFARINADNTISYLDATDFLAAIGGSAGSGTVTSVGITGSDFTITNSPITTSGNIGLVLAVVNANTGTYGTATKVAQITVNAKGLITAVTEVTITPAASSITGGEALTKADDTNVTLTLGGTPATSLLKAVSLTLGWTGQLSIARGGTGADTAAGARTNLGSSTVGDALFILSNPSAITFLRINADNSVSALNASDFRTAIGAGTGVGTVNSGTQYRIAYYATTGTAVSESSAITASRALKSDANGVPTHFDTSIEPSLTELSYVKGVTSSIQTQIGANASISDYVRTLNYLGFTLKHQSLGIDLLSSATGQTLADEQSRYIVIGTVMSDITLTTFCFWQVTQGVFTPNNENSISLYSVNTSTGLLTKIGATANDGNIWKGTSTTFQTVALASGVPVTAGTVLVAMILYSNSAQTTAPVIIGAANVNQAGFLSAGLSNSAKLYGVVGSVTSSPPSINFSSITANIGRAWIGIY